MGANQQSPEWSLRGLCVVPAWSPRSRVATGCWCRGSSSPPCSALAAPRQRSPSESPGSGGHPGDPLTFSSHWPGRGRAWRGGGGASCRRRCWPRPGSAGAGSAAAAFLYRQVHPRPGVPAPAITPLSMSTRGFGGGNESLATSQARQSRCPGAKFVLVGEGLAAARQDGAWGRAGRWAGGCHTLLGAAKVPQQEQNGVSIPAPVPYPVEITRPS